MNVQDHDIKDLLLNYNNIAVYGLSTDKSKPSYKIPDYMRSKGYDVVGINPVAEGQTSDFTLYNSLSDVPAVYRKFINVFRRPEAIPEVIEDILSVGETEVIWLQLGISHTQAEKKAESAGIKVVSNRCLLVEHRKWL